MKPSPTEYTLLKALWAKSPLSGREIHESVADELNWSFSSTRKTLDRMVDKGLLSAEDMHGVKVFRPEMTKVNTIAGMMKEFASRVLEIEGAVPVTAFADSKILSKDELAELQSLLEEEAS